MQLLLTKKSRFTIALWMPVKTIRNCSGISERMRRSKTSHAGTLIESHGGHFEHLSEIYSYSCNSEMKCLRTQVDMAVFSSFGIWNSCPEFVCTFQLYPVYMYMYVL
jgi:hypothetical protein